MLLRTWIDDKKSGGLLLGGCHGNHWPTARSGAERQAAAGGAEGWEPAAAAGGVSGVRESGVCH